MEQLWMPSKLLRRSLLECLPSRFAPCDANSMSGSMLHLDCLSLQCLVHIWIVPCMKRVCIPFSKVQSFLFRLWDVCVCLP